MKPSLRRESLAQKKPGRLGDIEKAARKEADKIMFGSQYGREVIIGTLLRFAQRHGAKVRRETLKEILEIVRSEEVPDENPSPEVLNTALIAGPVKIAIASVVATKKNIEARILALTPRGSEKFSDECEFTKAEKSIRIATSTRRKK